MQVQSLRIPSYRRFKVDDTLPAAAVKRRHKLETYRDLRAEGCSQQTALRAIGWSRATYFRWAARYRKCGPQLGNQHARNAPAPGKTVRTLRRQSLHGQCDLYGFCSPARASESTVDPRPGRVVWGVCEAEKAPLLPPGPDAPKPCKRHPTQRAVSPVGKGRPNWEKIPWKTQAA